MLSDDTEHACLTAQALLQSPECTPDFARSLAWRLRWWLLGLPAAVGGGTLRALLKLWIGYSPRRSGSTSAGNGPAMRAPILGACLLGDPRALTKLVEASTLITHRDPRALAGALVVARAARHAVLAPRGELDGTALLPELCRDLADAELQAALVVVAAHLNRQASPAELAAALGQERGVSGYMHHTVPVALYCWLRYPADFRRALDEVIRLGGDTDTTGAIVGALAGGSLGASHIPEEWLTGIADWPRSVRWMGRLAERLARQFPGEGPPERCRPLALFWPAVPLRNLWFAGVVLATVLRRCFPPY
jgi:ADP-ribosylglycohydrolase